MRDVRTQSAAERKAIDRPLLSFFIPGLTVGGAEQVTVNIVNGLSARGYDIELLLSKFEGELKAQLSEQVTVIELSPARTSVFGLVAHLPALIGYLRRNEPDVLFSHQAHLNVVCLAASRVLDIDTVFVSTDHKTLGTPTGGSLKTRVVKWLIPHLYPSADRIIAVSQGVADSIVEQTPVDPEDISVLYNPIEVDAVRERAREPVDHEWIENDEMDVILFVGRIEHQKDLETWLRTFKRVHERNPDTRAVIAGKGSRREGLLKLAEEFGIADVVSMPGYVENPYRFMRQASVFLLTSRFEGLPTVLIEALACGCPVVATDCPSGPREILADGEYGRLAPVGDVDALAGAVTKTLTDPISSDRLRKRADEFAPDSVLDDYERFIHDHVTAVRDRTDAVK